MKRYLFTVLFLILALALKAQVGSWTLYPAYNEPQQIVGVGQTYYVLSEGDLYSVNTGDGSVVTYDKQKNLSDHGIAFIAWCQEARRLVIVYSNQNIDLMEENGDVVNISDYYFKSLSVDKTVYGLNVYGRYAYLATGFGIVKVNVAAAEISDTYTLGFRVDWTHLDEERIYAESQSAGCYAALLTANLLDHASWQRVGAWTKDDRSVSADLLAAVKDYKADGPRYNNFYRMVVSDGTLYTTGGLYIRGISEMQNPGEVQVYDGSEWSDFGSATNLAAVVGHVVADHNSIAVDPKNHAHIVVAGRTGVYEYLDGQFTRHYSAANSPLISAVSGQNPAYTLSEVAFDADGTLWILNIDQLLRQEADGSLVVATNAFKGGKGIAQLFIDSRGMLWFGFNHWDFYGLYCYDPATDELTTYKNFVNEDNTDVTSRVKAIAEDRQGNIWIGTTIGPLYLSRHAIDTGDNTFTQVKVPRNDGTNLADYLLSGIEINAIAVDGANRKWFGTSANGVYLISDDCYTQEANFTAADTPLVGDEVMHITVNPATGDVFFATTKGLCSYRSDASEGGGNLNDNQIVAYPNPVTPGYTGLITIQGFTYNSSVRIASASGTVVNEGQSNGGTYTWDGTDRDGRPVASGVYFILAATPDGKQSNLGKIAIIR